MWRQQRFHPCAHEAYLLEDFSFLCKSKKVTIRKVEWKDPIADIKLLNNDFLTISNNIPVSTIETLLQSSHPSLVGKNDETLLDEDIRKSNEILADQIVLSPSFLSMVETKVDEMSIKLNHPIKVKPHLYKAIIYQEDDFFDEHMDAQHDEGMVFTLSIELNVVCEKDGGDLIVDEYDLNHATEDKIRMAMFYHDTPHSVKRLNQGYRLSLIFDVIECPDQINEMVLNPHEGLFNVGFDRLREKGFNKLAIRSPHIYMSDYDLEGNNLKGVDRLFYELCKRKGAKDIKIADVCDDDGQLYYKEILTIIKINHAFANVYNNQEDYDSDENDHYHPIEDQSPDETPPKTKFVSINKIRPQYDEDNEYVAIKDDYLLGDTVFLKTNTKQKLAYKGDEEIHLGNEGFYGTVYSDVAIIVSF